MLTKIRGSSDVSTRSESGVLHAATESNSAVIPEVELLWSIVEQTLYDLALAGSPFIRDRDIETLRGARLHINLDQLWYLQYLGLEPDYFVNVLTRCKYLEPIKWRRISRNRERRWGLRNKFDAARTASLRAGAPTREVSDHHHAHLQNQSQPIEGYANV